MALPAFQKDLNVSETDVGLVGGAIRLGNALALPIGYFGDVHGRKRTMVYSSALYVILTASSGLAMKAWVFTLLQTLARGFMATQNNMSTIMIVECLNADDRGWGVGTFSAMGILGSAFALVVFGFVGDLPSAWRYLYVFSGMLFLPLICMTRNVPESKRFVDTLKNKSSNQIANDDDQVLDEENTVKPTINSENEDEIDNEQSIKFTKEVYLKRIIACCLVSFFNGFSFAPSETFKIKKLMEVHGLSAAGVSIIQITTGLAAFASFTLAGSLSDRFGRKRFLIVFNAMCAVGVAVFFITPAGPLVIVYAANFVLLLSGFVLSVVKGAYFAELFPTTRRSTAQGLFVFCDVIGGAIALVFESLLYTSMGHWTACAVLTLPSFFSPCVVAMLLPEVTSKELDQVSPETFLIYIPKGIFSGNIELVGDTSSRDDDHLALRDKDGDVEDEDGLNKLVVQSKSYVPL